jgi:NOL1/NOP2/sun family putative RNA methylase
MIPSLVLNPQLDDVTVDMCAAPGGKTVHLAQLLKNKGVILALDLNRKRMKSLRSNLARCGVRNVIAIRMDAANLVDLKVKGISKILLDAPCSGSGLIPTDPTRKYSRSFKDIEFCSSIQMKLIQAAINSLESKGEFVYSTCSIEPEENEFIIDTVLNQFEVEIMELDIDFGVPGLTHVFQRELSADLRKARRLYPFLHGTEGFFICKLMKV